MVTIYMCIITVMIISLHVVLRIFCGNISTMSRQIPMNTDHSPPTNGFGGDLLDKTYADRTMET